jgi:AraC family transcriptional regulator of adaptative response/methylated-DNA-[protein]-cysteine methyltransferase
MTAMLVNKKKELEIAERPLSYDEMWSALTSRNRDYDGYFFFGVRSTGIYCRPSCAARRPARDLVVFFSTTGEAEREGFRACLRCKPKGYDLFAQQGKIGRACDYLNENSDRGVSLQELGDHVGMSPFHLQRVFRRTVGVSPREYSEAKRLERMKLSLRNGESVRKSIYGSGYNSTSWLYEGRKSKLGMPPSAFKAGGMGQQILYAIVDCPLGRLLVAGTEMGICAVSLGDSDRKLEKFLWSGFPHALISRDESGVLEGWIRTIVSYLQGEKRARVNELPLDVVGTAFERRVWKELQKVPYGATRSYSEIAKEINEPRAVRAVANACARNPTCLIVPCHRVVRKNGDPGGYRWGLKRKQKLLEMERTALGHFA